MDNWIFPPEIVCNADYALFFYYEKEGGRWEIVIQHCQVYIPLKHIFYKKEFRN